MVRAIAVLIRNTSWKCGRIERLIVDYMQRQILGCGRAQAPIREILQQFKLNGKQTSDFLEAIKRLEKRHIIKIEAF
jgi:hypothetical protein